MRWSAAFTLLGATVSAFAVDTATLIASVLSPDCLAWRVVGVCYWLSCSMFGCTVQTSVKVRHYVPDAVVSSYSRTGANPWTEVSFMSAPLPFAQGGGSGTTNQPHENNLAVFKNADVIGHPGMAAFGQFAGQFGMTCPGAGVPFDPYLLSTFDTIAWRDGIPESVYPESLIPGMREIGSRTTANLWGSVYPTCRQWWSDGSIGLRARLLQQVDPDLLTKIGQWAGFASQNQVDDDVIRTIVAPRQQVLNQGQVYADYGGQIGKTLPNAVTRGAGDLGLTVGSLGLFPAMDVVRQALPMVLSFLKMAFVICLPLVLVIGTYDLKAVVTASCVEFALFFVDFWFQLARWVDSTILDALYGHGSPHENFNPLMGLNNAMGDMLLNFVMATMFLVLPAFWIAALGWAGVSVGNALRALNDS
ncbi:TIGR03756 family integrating conjugative element protein, partial [Burkholderia multivorans]